MNDNEPFRPEHPHSTTIPSLTPQQASPLATHDSIIPRRYSAELQADYAVTSLGRLAGQVKSLENRVAELERVVQELQSRG